MTQEKQWKTLEQLAQRMLVLQNQLGDLAHDIQVATTQELGEEELHIFKTDLEDDYSDVLAQIYQLGVELGIVAEGEGLNIGKGFLPKLQDGIAHMQRRKQEYLAKGRKWI